MNIEKIEKETIEQSKEQSKKIAKFLSKLLLKALKPFIPYIIAALVVFMLLIMLIAAVYSAMPQLGALAGVTQKNEESDQKARLEYQKLCDQYNVEDTWLINQIPCEPGTEKYESTPDSPFYPGKGIRKMGVLADPYGSDQALILQWSQLHAACLYRAYNFGQNKITNQEDVANGLHPFFYYKQSYVITQGKDGTEKRIQYLLVEAYTIKGHYQYQYDWATKTYGSDDDKVTITQEELTDTQQILPNKWQRLEDWVVDEYELKKSDETPLIRTAIWEAGNAFDKQKEWLDWLIHNVEISDYTSSAMIPPEIMSCFKEAEEKFGIPWWFLAAVANKESNFNPQAENKKSHCYGLMQVSPGNWAHYAPLLGFDPAIDKDNPRAQVIVGTYLLKNYLGNINWKGDNWKEETLHGLTFFSGYRSKVNGRLVVDERAMKRCRNEYASIVWGYADSYKNQTATWPTPGYTNISSPFGQRYHPIQHVWKFHNGIDIPAPTGKPVVSVSAGVVKTAGWVQGYGKCIEIVDAQHKYLYGHLSRIDVSTGETVQPGQQIGAVGSTGNSTGPHLHFGVWKLDSGGWIDPLLVLQKN